MKMLKIMPLKKCLEKRGKTKNIALFFISIVLIFLMLKATTTFATTKDINPESYNRLFFVLFINNNENPFWRLTKIAAEKAAKDLNINLQVVSLNNNPLRPLRVLSTLLSSPRKPDAILFSNMKNTGRSILELLEKHKIHSFIYDNGFPANDKIGLPGSEFLFWQAELLSNNEAASRKLTLELIDTARQNNQGELPLSLIALEGSPSSEVNAERLRGMYNALKTNQGNIIIKQVFRTHWDPKHAKNATLSAHRRYPKTSLIWAANDEIAISATNAMIELGRVPGKDVFISGFDRLPRTLQRIEQGEIVNSYGGQYMSAAWGIVYMFDFYNGFNLAHRSMEFPLTDRRTFSPVRYDKEIRQAQFEKINFKIFSKTLTPTTAPYDFLLPPEEVKTSQ